jgi:hypothetical protein
VGSRYVEVETEEAFPGAATVVNMWEGIGSLSRALTNAYGSSADKYSSAGVSAAEVVTKGLNFSNNLAQRCLR